MRHKWLPSPRLLAFAPLALALIIAVACGTAEETPAAAPAAAATAAPAAAMPENTPVAQGSSGSSGAPAVAATAMPEATAMPAAQDVAAPRGTLTFGLPLVAPFHVFPTVTEGAGYHHNGYTTAETLLYMNEDKEIVPWLFQGMGGCS